jgi:hypothetical protein
MEYGEPDQYEGCHKGEDQAVHPVAVPKRG